jgi:16S rRNA (adenine(1408)-N(1))-methyltransferase
VLGVDSSHAAMAEASRRAARPIRRGGLPNARFVVAAAESLPGELARSADLVTVHFPWGSLLRGATGADPEVADRLACLVAVGGRLRLLLPGAPADAQRGVAEVDRPASSRPSNVWGWRPSRCGRRRWLMRMPPVHRGADAF